MKDLQNKLYTFFGSLESHNRCLYIDTFTSLCWMHKCGQKVAALKLLPDLFKAVAGEAQCQYKQLLSSVIGVIDGNEEMLVAAVPTRHEFKMLFRSQS